MKLCLRSLVKSLYSALIYVSLPCVFTRLCWRGRKNPGYREHLAERLGFLPFELEGAIWIHAVSLGESIAAKPLIEKLRERYPNSPLFITNTTPTGRAWISHYINSQNPNSQIHQAYLPYDTPYFIQKMLKQVRPKILILMETELWPNLLWVTHQAGIPSFLANARLSERSFLRYQKIKPLTTLMLLSLSSIAAQHTQDQARFLKLGYPKNSITTTGSLKFDMQLPKDLEFQKNKLETLGLKDRPIWIAASTHAGEEGIILEAHQKILKTYSNALLILVPRHPERFKEVGALISNSHFDYQTKSSQTPLLETTQVFLGDTLGELLVYYACSQIAFVGGSLKPIGGHNLLEPAALSIALLTGPYVHNFQAITTHLIQQGAATSVRDAITLAECVIELFDHPSLRLQMGQSARACFLENQGATLRHMELIGNLIKSI